MSAHGFMNERLKADVSGFAALLLWSSSALLVSYCKDIPIFLISSVSALIGFAIFVAKWRFCGEDIAAHFKIRRGIIILAVVGIGVYRLLYYASFSLAPAVEVNLINYLWPILIVIFSSLLPGEKVCWHHIAGGLCGFAGLFWLLGEKAFVTAGLSIGHLFALLMAVEWAVFSIASRMAKGYSSDAVPVSFLITGLLYLAVHFAIGETGGIAPAQWPFVIAIGVVGGLGYFLWDVGMKHGDIQVLGASSYLVPLVSTALLVLFGQAEPSAHVLGATALIFAGSLLAGQEKVTQLLAWLQKK